jgi:hypothetical protein
MMVSAKTRPRVFRAFGGSSSVKSSMRSGAEVVGKGVVISVLSSF